MAILAPRNAQEAKFQYCNYGYRAKYTSFEDCMARHGKDIAKEQEPKVETILGNDLTSTQKWAWVIGLTLAAWGLIYWSEKQPNK
jgi:hypothetical protein